MIFSIDPGQNGALAYFNDDGTLFMTEKMPSTIDGLRFFFRHLGLRQVILEHVGQGRLGNSMQSVSTFARHRGVLDAVIDGLPDHIDRFYYTPTEWQSAIRKKTDVLAGRFREASVTKHDIHAWVRSQVSLKVPLYAADAVALGLFHFHHRKPAHESRQAERRARALLS